MLLPQTCHSCVAAQPSLTGCQASIPPQLSGFCSPRVLLLVQPVDDSYHRTNIAENYSFLVSVLLS